MKLVPENPYAFQERMMTALIGDIWDTKTKGTPRLDALRAATNASREQAYNQARKDAA